MRKEPIALLFLRALSFMLFGIAKSVIYVNTNILNEFQGGLFPLRLCSLRVSKQTETEGFFFFFSWRKAEETGTLLIISGSGLHSALEY